MKDVIIQTIPHSEHRYETVGDYFDEEVFMPSPSGTYSPIPRTRIEVSDMKNPDYEFLVVFHELIEWYLTQKRGIKEEDITVFDIGFETERLEGKHKDTDEPGDDPAAPYYKEHQFATKLEKKMATELGVDWDEYDKKVEDM